MEQAPASRTHKIRLHPVQIQSMPLKLRWYNLSHIHRQYNHGGLERTGAGRDSFRVTQATFRH